MHVLVTRPRPAALRTAKALKAAGHLALIAPVIEIVATGARLPEGRFDAVIASSENAFVHPRDLRPILHLPLYAVGETTAEAGRTIGFREVKVAEGDAVSLARLIGRSLPQRSRLLALVGRDRTESFDSTLTQANYVIAACMRYCADALETLPEQAAEALSGGTLDACLHYSGRSAAIAFELADRAGLGDPMRALIHVAISPGVARVIERHGGRDIRTATSPAEAPMLACLDTGNPDTGRHAAHD